MNADYRADISVGKITYEIETCSAVVQYNIMRIFVRHALSDVLMNIALTHENPDVAKKITAATLFGALTKNASDEEVDYIVDNILCSVAVKGTSKPVTIEDFRDNMIGYSTLIFNALEANFKDFTAFLSLPQLRAQEQTK